MIFPPNKQINTIQDKEKSKDNRGDNQASTEEGVLHGNKIILFLSKILDNLNTVDEAEDGGGEFQVEADLQEG